MSHKRRALRILFLLYKTSLWFYMSKTWVFSLSRFWIRCSNHSWICAVAEFFLSRCKGGRFAICFCVFSSSGVCFCEAFRLSTRHLYRKIMWTGSKTIRIDGNWILFEIPIVGTKKTWPTGSTKLAGTSWTGFSFEISSSIGWKERVRRSYIDLNLRAAAAMARKTANTTKNFISSLTKLILINLQASVWSFTK